MEHYLKGPSSSAFSNSLDYIPVEYPTEWVNKTYLGIPIVHLTSDERRERFLSEILEVPRDSKGNSQIGDVYSDPHEGLRHFIFRSHHYEKSRRLLEFRRSPRLFEWGYRVYHEYFLSPYRNNLTSLPQDLVNLVIGYLVVKVSFEEFRKHSKCLWNT